MRRRRRHPPPDVENADSLGGFLMLIALTGDIWTVLAMSLILDLVKSGSRKEEPEKN